MLFGRRSGVGTILVLAAMPVLAQSVVDSAAQEQYRRQERERALRQREERQPDVRLPAPAVGDERVFERPFEPETPCFEISRIVLVGEEAERFEYALRTTLATTPPILPRCLGAHGIEAILGRVQNAIIAAGFVTTRVLAAPQDLKTGRLEFTVIPGRVRAIRFADGSNPRASLAGAFPIRAGDLLNLRDIEQGLENLKRAPTVEADIQILPADTPGESDLAIAWKQAFPLRVTLSADDAGARATGKNQDGVTLSADNPLGLNDLFYISVNRDLGNGANDKRGTRGHTLHYSVPHGYWTLGVTAGRHDYHQSVAGINQAYRYSSTGNHAEIKLSRLIHRDAVRKTTASLRGFAKSSRNYIDDAEIEVQRRRMAGWEAALAHREFIGAATVDASLAWRQGTGAWGALHAPEEPFGEGTARPRMVLADAALNHPFALGGQRLRFNAVWRAQRNRTPLVPQDRFAIGGRHTVRGFDGESVLSAERGWLLRNDLGWALGDSGQELYFGIDHGRVGGASADLLVGRKLTGAVFGLRGGVSGIGGMSSFNYDLFVGQPVKKPEGFKTARTTAGFNLNWTF